MSLFMTFINFIEAFIFPLFLSYYFDLNNKNKFILLSGFIQFTVLNLCSYYNQSGYMLTVFIILFNIVSLKLTKKIMTFNYIIITITYNFTILATTFCGMYISLFLQKMFDYTNNTHIVFTCLIAKSLLIIVTYFLIKQNQKKTYTLNIENWKIVLLFQATLVTSTVMAGNSIASGNIEISSLLILLILLVILNFSFFSIINKINTLNEEKLEYQKQLQQEEFNKETLKTIKSIKHEVQAIDHRLFYIVYEIEKLLKNNEFDKIQIILDKYKDLIIKHNMSVDTGNSVFDCLISLKINDMIANDISIKTCMFISRNNYYNDLILINFIMDILDKLYLSRFVDIELKETKGFLKIGFIFDHTNINLKKFEDDIIEILPSIKGSYKLLQSQFTELRIGLKLGDYHD